CSSDLVDMEAVFEQYVRNVLRDSGQIREGNLTVLDGNKEGKGWLFSDTKVHEAKPDLILKKKDLVLLIGDAKYKPKATEQDRYQVMAHALSYRTKRALLVSPTNPGGPSGLKRIGMAGGESGIELFHYYIDLESS